MLRDLTAEQRRAVGSSAHALEIRAGAGTGKTTTLTHRLARLASEGTAEHRLLAVTFTRDATAALQRKLGILLGRSHAVRVASFHAWAAQESRSEGLRFLDQGDARGLLLRTLQRRPAPVGLSFALGVGAGDDLAGRALGFLSYVRNAETTVGDAILRQFPTLAPWELQLEELQDAYVSGKGERLDFDDLLLHFRDRLKRSRAFRDEVAGRIEHLAVDEYQDVNRAQADIVRLLSTTARVPVTVVGDPRQSIYGFRGADPSRLETFLDDHGRKGQRIALTRSFRATRALVDAANLALPDEHPLRPRPRAPAGTAPTLLAAEDPRAEASAAADHLAALLARGIQPADCVVLVRRRGLGFAYADELRERRDDALRAVPVMTIHAAKGLEWDHVLILGAREGGIPSEQALQAEPEARERLLAEERRLLYVAVTRARKSLLITWPERGERRRYAACRWLENFNRDAAPKALVLEDARSASESAQIRIPAAPPSAAGR